MYFPYEKTGNLINFFCKNKCVQDFFYNHKVLQNISYISRNKPKVLEKLKEKLESGEKLKVVFYVYDETKWKCQSLYNLLSADVRFDVKILVTKTSCLNRDNSSYISDEEVEKTFNFFKKLGLNVEYTYDLKKAKFIPFKRFKPDIIFYQHPWYVKTEQGPVVCSKFALTCYVPYYFPIETADVDCKLRFHDYVENYYILDEYTKQKYLKKNPKLEQKLKVVGYPYLDYFNSSDSIEEKEYVIYAPHWTICGKGLKYGTFEWSGDFMLQYAEGHPEIKWIFKPHPLLKKALSDFGLMNEKEAEEYYRRWENIGIRYESGNYLKLFAKSKMMITDCSSFLGEYFVTGSPLIHLMSEDNQFKKSENPILKTYYRANNLDELKNLIHDLPTNDYMKELRLKLLNNIGLNNINSSANIAEDLINQILSAR